MKQWHTYDIYRHVILLNMMLLTALFYGAHLPMPWRYQAAFGQPTSPPLLLRRFPLLLCLHACMHHKDSFSQQLARSLHACHGTADDKHMQQQSAGCSTVSQQTPSGLTHARVDLVDTLCLPTFRPVVVKTCLKYSLYDTSADEPEAKNIVMKTRDRLFVCTSLCNTTNPTP